MIFWQRDDALRQLLPNVDLKEVQRLRNLVADDLGIQKYRPIFQALENLPTADSLGELRVTLDEQAVKITSDIRLDREVHQALETTIQTLAPWRKGPFQLFDRFIDSEWQSWMKWDRIEPALGELRGRKILDVGCGNGYYMFRAAAHDPKLVIGLDPSVQFLCVFELMQRFIQNPRLQYERLGCQHLRVFDQAFDIALCMGVLYHQRSPIEILRDLRKTIRVGGFAIIESQTIPGSGSLALFPEDRYAKARNVFFVPTQDCLVNWVKRSGFKNVEVVSHTKVGFDEQRATQDMTWESLKDYLNPQNENETIEGYPAPYRTVVRGERSHL